MSLIPAGTGVQKVVFAMIATWVAGGFLQEGLRSFGVYNMWNPYWNLMIAVGILLLLVRYVR
ncbi:hypothetical protein Metev_0620 [Methanohalobium evestigatum Z-7303]|uniref:Uncharacterized protein n=1 Tax=Methanohalobium evestigatum (strain ATCC BAA-1072 / DSM 3721 / NBRC 107634 / OCM 161 / Z-7303) TaxID=644295 RepID=D7E8I4_METEZ|nr:hypothetical protein [Methanohalobium evestigatum]ADI73526.1 hypothetical protein Metev_0620 [Methanohalobium evestigatum Z-7303]